MGKGKRREPRWFDEAAHQMLLIERMTRDPATACCITRGMRAGNSAGAIGIRAARGMYGGEQWAGGRTNG